MCLPCRAGRHDKCAVTRGAIAPCDCNDRDHKEGK